jgi:hypothetical protein
MTDDRLAPLESLLAEAEAAHGIYEATELNGVYDTDWPRWYASYAVEHGIDDVLGRSITADELAGILASGWDELQRADPRPDEPWTRFMARRVEEASRQGP